MSSKPLLTKPQFQRLVMLLLLAGLVVAVAAAWLSPGPLGTLRSSLGLGPTFLVCLLAAMLSSLPPILALRRISDLPPLAADLRAQWEEVQRNGGLEEAAAAELGRRSTDPTWYLGGAVVFAAIGAIGVMGVWDVLASRGPLPVVLVALAVAGLVMPPILVVLAWRTWRRPDSP
jgi:hypothetical protein